MNNQNQTAYAKIVQLVERNIIGKPQIIIVSVNTLKKGQTLIDKICSELTLCDGIINGQIKNQSVKLSHQGYAHGFISRQYCGGQILRYTYTCAPVQESTQITVYGNDGEIRYFSETDKIFTLKQIPDYVGDEITEQFNIEGVIDFEKCRVGKTVVNQNNLKENQKIACEFAK